jgi:hypothetical protein
MTTKAKESERFDEWWRTQDWDGAYMDVAWDAWWEAVRDASDEEIIEVLLPDQEQKREIARLRRFLTAIEAGFNFKRMSAAEMASEARAALDGALEPSW